MTEFDKKTLAYWKKFLVGKYYFPNESRGNVPKGYLPSEAVFDSDFPGGRTSPGFFDSTKIRGTDWIMYVTLPDPSVKNPRM
ncbi:4814_t:CDS:2 [Ambispora gerdemannii]|uniref:4814_t:CDS:1 n=1 Tax=Ambispora gerdemannii TaxID=144530 RepID=A0A9N9AJW3_9GLOM|nr:4814_t:CDS:2 [Ambispora gerdemannii]